MKTIVLLVGSAALCVFLYWTHSLPGSLRNYTVKDLLADPRDFYGKTVDVSGIVGDTFAVMGTGYFRLKDREGNQLMILSGQGTPVPGKPYTVHGSLRQAYAVGASQMLVFVEAPEIQGERK